MGRFFDAAYASRVQPYAMTSTSPLNLRAASVRPIAPRMAAYPHPRERQLRTTLEPAPFCLRSTPREGLWSSCTGQITSASVLDLRRCSPGNRLKSFSYHSRVWRVKPLVVSGNIDIPSILLPLPSGALSLSTFNFAYQLLSVLDV